MIKDYENNEFIQLIYDLYDCINFPEKDDIILTEKRGKGLFGYFKKEVIKTNIRLKNIENKIENFIGSLSKNTLDFNTLWDFCEFIRVAEKIFFYNNSLENMLFVEYTIDKNVNSERKFRIKLYDDFNSPAEIRFILERDLLGKDIISITVKRNYGLEMENSYKIVDGNTPYNDSSDLYLINQINIILKECVIDKFIQIKNYVYDN